MKKMLSIVTLICLFVVAISSISCSEKDDPADNDFFVGTYKGNITYVDNNGGKKTADNGSVTVIKVGDDYYFRFSDEIPDLKGVSFKKDGDHMLVNLDFKDGVQVIRINASSLFIQYSKDGKTWTANAKR